MRKYLLIGGSVLLVALLLGSWYAYAHRQQIALHFIQPPPPREVVKIKTVRAECVPVVHYVKEEAVKADLVPEYVKDDPDKQVTAAIETPAHRAPTLVTSVFDFSTGINTLSYQQKPIPFWEIPGTWALGGRYGLSTEEGDRYDVHARWTALRTGNLYWSAYGEINSRPEALIMLDIEYRGRD